MLLTLRAQIMLAGAMEGEHAGRTAYKLLMLLKEETGAPTHAFCACSASWLLGVKV